MARTRKKAIWVDTEATYGTDPSSDGSGYLWVPALEISDLSDGKELLDTNYATGHNFPTAPIAGADGWSFNFTVPLIGMASSAGDGTNAGSVGDDWLDALLTHVFGTQTNTQGEGVSSVPDATGVVLDADSNDAGDMIVLHEDSVPATERAQWSIVTADNGGNDFDVAPGWTDFGSNPPTGAAISYGVKQYSFDDDGGASLAFFYSEDDVEYTLLGGRCTAASIEWNAGQIARMSFTFSGDTRTTGSKASKPAAGAAPAVEPCKVLLSPFWFNGTRYAVSGGSVDLGISATPISSTEAENMRSGYELTRGEPTFTVTPLRTDALQNLKRNATQGRLLMQIGSGAGDGDPINSVAIACEECVTQSADPSDDDGVLRTSLQLKAYDSGTGSTAALRRRYFFQMGRA